MLQGKTGKKQSINMTQGPIWKLLLLFTVPLIFGNLFQELYSTVDSIVIGNYVGKTGLAAVGATTSICNTLVRFFNGFSIGAGVVVSAAFGANDVKKLRRAVETIMAIGLVAGAVITLVSLPFTSLMLRAMSTPDDVIVPAANYLRIYIGGIVFLFTYNMGSCILRAVGDTKRPLYYLIVTSLVNIVLDLVLVVRFGMGIEGTAWATIFSEAVSAVLVWRALGRSEEGYRLAWRRLHIDWGITKQICVVGLPSAIQQGLTSFSNAFVQGYINSFDSAVMAGWSCHLKVDQFAILPVQSMGQAATTFVSQNIGAGQLDRVKKGVKQAIWMSTGFMVGISVLIYFSASGLVSLFNREPDVLFYGVTFITLMVPFRFASAWNQVYGGALRGAGDSRSVMIIMLFSFVFCRQIYLYIITRFIRNVYTVGLGYPVGWMVCALLSRWYYYHGPWEKRARKLLGNNEES